MKLKLFALFMLIGISLQAQVRQVIRKELDMKDNGVDAVSVVGEKGIVVYGYVNEPGAADVLQIRAYNNQFEEIAVKEFDYPKKTIFSRSVVSEDKTHIYFFYLSKQFHYLLLSYNIDNGEMKSMEADLGERFSPFGDIYTLNGRVFVTGTRKGTPNLFTLDPATERFTYTEIPGDNKKRTIESVAPYEAEGKLAVFYRDGKSMKSSLFYMSVFDSEGDLLDNTVLIDKNPEFSIIDGSITWLKEGSYIISGTYGTRNSTLSTGIYFSRFNNDVQEFITYNSFTDFADFYQFLPERSKARAERKVERRKEQGKEDVIKCLVAIHPLVVKEDHYLFIGEVYFPTYHTETRTTFVNGVASTTSYQVFDGYQYSHAVVAGIDENGNKQFDRCFKMYLSIKPFSVIKNIHVTEENSEVTKLLFSTGSRLEAVNIDGDQMSSSELGEIVSDTEGDNLRWTSFTQSAYWYENYFIVYGSQKIKNKENEGVDRKRIVFFLSKIAFED